MRFTKTKRLCTIIAAVFVLSAAQAQDVLPKRTWEELKAESLAGANWIGGMRGLGENLVNSVNRPKPVDDRGQIGEGSEHGQGRQEFGSGFAGSALGSDESYEKTVGQFQCEQQACEGKSGPHSGEIERIGLGQRQGWCK